MSRSGHLSNEATRELLEQLRHDRLEHVILAHLSETNNSPDRALSVVSQALEATDIGLSVAHQDSSGDLFCLS